MTTLHIRPFTPDDYPALSRLGNRIFPEYPGTPDEIRFGDEHRDPKCKWARFVVEQDGAVVGSAEYGQSSHSYHPQKFGIDVSVDPDHQEQGIGRRGYAHLRSCLEEFEPIALKAGAREDYTRSTRFLTDRGFAETMRNWESRLDVPSFDFAPFAGEVERALTGSIHVKTLAELEADPECRRKLYDLYWELDQDVPSTDPPTRRDFDTWEQHYFEAPNMIKEANFVALDGEEYVGISVLWNSQGSDDLYTGLTGVKRTHRRRGIAQALKLLAVQFAKERGAPVIKTWNAQQNRAMLSINERMGFVKQPAWIDYELKL